MKRIQCWRYTCDFCGKKGYSSGHMRSHETHCTANPDRKCRIHRYVDLRTTNPGPLQVSVLVAHLREHWKDEDHGVAALRELAEGCPCCMLAACRQSGASKGIPQDEEGPGSPPWIDTKHFDFKKEIAELWQRVNEKVNESYY